MKLKGKDLAKPVKLQIYEHLASISQAIGHENRLELLELLAQGQRSVEDLASMTTLSVANTSRHLQILKRARLVETQRQGKYIFYNIINHSEVVSLLHALGIVGERNHAEIRQIVNDYFEEDQTLLPVSHIDLVKLIKEDDVILLDVRPYDEYRQGHLPKALNIQLDELQNQLTNWSKDDLIVAYCRGPYCILSVKAVQYLREQGFNVRRLQEGYPEWKSAGWETET